MTSRRRLAAIMFTDMVGYTSLTQENEALAHELLEEHRKLLRPLFKQHNGKEIKTIGDAFHVEFSSALHAVRCAVEIQSVLHGHNLATTRERKIQIRIGIHLGDVDASEGDIYGDDVNIAARIEPLADPGGICISEDVARKVDGKIDVPLTSLGTKDLKNIAKPLEVFKIAFPWETSDVQKSSNLRSFSSSSTFRIASILGVIAILLVIIWLVFNPFRQPTDLEFAPGEIESLAVLPFVDISEGSENEYFCDGMTEELLNALSRIEGLRVPARTYSFWFKDKAMPISEVASRLEVQAVLEGSVRKSGDQIRITVQLIGADNMHIWSEQFDREMSDIFTLQEEIAQAIVQRLNLEVPSTQPLVKSGTDNVEAYDLYLQGLFHREQFQYRERLELAIDYFEQAIEIDADFASAYAGLADAYTLLQNQGYLRLDEAEEPAKAAVQRALELDPELAEAHFSLAMIYFQFDRNLEAAENEFLTSINLYPGNDEVHFIYAQMLRMMGRLDEAIEEALKAVAINPVSPQRRYIAGYYLFKAGRDQEAVEQYEKGLELDPKHLGSLTGLGVIKRWNGDANGAAALFQEAMAVDDNTYAGTLRIYALFLGKEGRFAESEQLFQHALEDAPDRADVRHDYAWIQALSGNFEDALVKAEEMYDDSPQNAAVSLFIARVLVMMGKNEEALGWLEQADKLNMSSMSDIDSLVHTYRGIVFNRMGDHVSARSELNTLLQQPETEDWAFAASLLYLELDDLDSFFKYMDRSYTNRDGLYLTIKIHPMLEKARSDPRFDELVAKIGNLD